MIQGNQPTWCIDSWPYYEFEDYIKLLNERNEEERKAKEESEKQQGGLTGSPDYRNMMRGMSKYNPSNFKPPKMPKF